MPYVSNFMVWSKLNKFSPLLSEVAISCSLTVMAALALEWLKPGLISNFMDLNLLSLVTIVLVIAAALLGPRRALSGWTRWYYGIWTVLVGSLVLKVIFRLVQFSSVWWFLGTGSLLIVVLWFVIITSRHQHD